MPSMEELNNLEKMSSDDKERWGIDKKIPIALIGVVIFQTVAITWGAATLSNDVKNYGEKIVKIENNFDKFVEKADDKFMTRDSHNLVKQSVSGELANIKSDIRTLEDRVRWLETHIK